MPWKNGQAGDGTVLPIEVKSGKDYERHNALPIYMTTFIRKKQEIPGIYKVLLKLRTKVRTKNKTRSV